MAAQYAFTDNVHGEKIMVILSQIESYKYDAFSECVQLTLKSGKKIAVQESMETVKALIDQL